MGRCLLRARNDYKQSLPAVLTRLSGYFGMELGNLKLPSDIFIIVDEMGIRNYIFRLSNSIHCCKNEWSWTANFFRTGVPYNLIISRTCTSTDKGGIWNPKSF